MKRSDSDVYEGMKVVSGQSAQKKFQKVQEKKIERIESNQSAGNRLAKVDTLEGRYVKQMDDVKKVMVEYKEMFEKLERILGCTLIDRSDDRMSEITESTIGSKIEGKDLFEF